MSETPENEENEAKDDAAPDGVGAVEPSAEAPGTTEGAAEVEPAAGVAVAVTPHESQARHDFRERFWVPLLVPLCSVIAVVVLAINISRVFLSSSHNIAVVIASVITVAILVGATVMSSASKVRSQTLTLVLAAVVVIIIASGLATIGTADESGEASGGFVAPTGPAVATVTVDALPTLKFQSKTFDTQNGVNEMVYVGKGGTHTLVIDSLTTAGFELAVSGAETDKGKVDLKPGTYEMYCTIPGHKAAGMDATLTVK